MLDNATLLNPVHNGGFETEFLNGGFDWRSQPIGQISVSLDTKQFHGGNRSLRIEFTGPAVSDVGIYEYVPVQPGTAYRLLAFVKTEELTTASGPRLGIEESSTRKYPSNHGRISGYKQLDVAHGRIHDRARHTPRDTTNIAHTRQSIDQGNSLAR